MSKRIILLIIASILGLIALSLIQGYLIKNTYTLKKDAFISIAEEAINGIDDYETPLDSIDDAWSDTFIGEVDKFSVKAISKEQLLERLQTITDSLNPGFLREYHKIITKQKLGYNLKYHRTLQTIILTDSAKSKIIFKADSQKPFTLFGNVFRNNPDLYIGSSVWQTERSFSKEIKGIERNVSYQLYLKSSKEMNIDDLNIILFNQMRGLLLLSLFIFVFVIGVLYYSIKNLITQKKIADVKTDFINNITHEFKTPLATLSLATKILKKQKEIHREATTITTIDTIERQNVRLQKLVDQVLDNSLGYQEIVLQKEVVLVQDYFSTLINDFQLSLKEDSVNLNTTISNASTKISLDKFYMATAVLNILENAVKYGGSLINILVSVAKDELEVHIEDNGIGMPKKHLKDVFEKFYRIANQQIHDVKGLGLGLYYSSQIIKVHNGVILLESEKGKGSTFIIKIPFS
ncbi:sensor histidine kinase [Tenacibaculum amylolyticum]|uniref:sensor histidine kinase n=1 Tax=Tenacibaculum amylolyticum TaxID=104269 RepID=UPI003892D7AD